MVFLLVRCEERDCDGKHLRLYALRKKNMSLMTRMNHAKQDAVCYIQDLLGAC